MPSLRRVYHVARADFLQRTRSKRFLVVLATIAYIGYLVNVGDISLYYQQQTGGAEFYRGIGNAAWIGMKAGLTGAFFVGIAGFYVLKNVLSRDRSTGVGTLVASTCTTDRTYLLGKWMSNVAVVAVMLGTLAGATVVNHAVHGVGSTDVVTLVTPVFLLGLPLGALVGAVSILFETTDRLNGTLGNIVYFFGAVTAFSALTAVGTIVDSVPFAIQFADVFGYLTVYAMTSDALLNTVSNYAGGPPSFGIITGEVSTFTWNGSTWPPWVYAQRGIIALFGVVIVSLSVPLFDRFDPTARSDTSDSSLTDEEAENVVTATALSDSVAPSNISLTPVTERNAGGFKRLLLAEVRLALKPLPRWWYIGAIAIAVVGLLPVVPLSMSREILLPLGLGWPLFVWSKMGVRPTQHQTAPLIFSSRWPLRQLFSEWCVGALLVVAMTGGVVGRLVASGVVGSLAGYAAAIVFVPSFALVLGVWSEQSRTFEALYLVLWYVGLVNRLEVLDFAGISDASVKNGTPIVFLVLGGVLFGAALLRRYLDTR
ncbi:hypothetical protein [Halorussus amylolyticus]|uniref:hypothetical protein n=1 Tax=Halorussus amylolyticus TaxID=1126242 RepID=UPI001047ADEE|nr:hypothetical protein [Halorussus amylolyticus]